MDFLLAARRVEFGYFFFVGLALLLIGVDALVEGLGLLVVLRLKSKMFLIPAQASHTHALHHLNRERD